VGRANRAIYPWQVRVIIQFPAVRLLSPVRVLPKGSTLIGHESQMSYIVSRYSLRSRLHCPLIEHGKGRKDGGSLCYQLIASIDTFCANKSQSASGATRLTIPACPVSTQSAIFYGSTNVGPATPLAVSANSRIRRDHEDRAVAEMGTVKRRAVEIVGGIEDHASIGRALLSLDGVECSVFALVLRTLAVTDPLPSFCKAGPGSSQKVLQQFFCGSSSALPGP
jgi:hypothetical protein